MSRVYQEDFTAGCLGSWMQEESLSHTCKSPPVFVVSGSTFFFVRGKQSKHESNMAGAEEISGRSTHA